MSIDADLIVSPFDRDTSSVKMRINRVVANIETSDVDRADTFYHDVLGLERVMDHGWIRTYGSNSKMTVQVSFASEGGSGTPVPVLSIEVDDIETTLTRSTMQGIQSSMVQKVSLEEYEGSMSEIRSKN